MTQDAKSQAKARVVVKGENSAGGEPPKNARSSDRARRLSEEDKPEEKKEITVNYIRHAMAHQAAEMSAMIDSNHNCCMKWLDQYEEKERVAEFHLQELKWQLESTVRSHKELLHTAEKDKAMNDALVHAHHGHAKKLLIMRDQAARVAESENFRLREQLASLQAVGRSNVLKSSVSTGKGWYNDSDPQVSMGASMMKTTMQSTAGASGLESGVLDRLENAQRVLETWATNHHPKLPAPPSESESDESGAELPGMLPDRPGTSGTAEENAEALALTNQYAQYKGKKRGDKKMKKGAKFLAVKERVNTMVFDRRKTTDYYYETGCMARTVRSSSFESATMVAIFLNAIWIGVDTGFNGEDFLLNAHPVFIVGENLFTTFFTFEILIRFCAFERKLNAIKDYWFDFDCLLVAQMIIDTWVMFAVMAIQGGTMTMDVNAGALRTLRLLRVTRVARIARLLRFVPEVFTLVKGVGIALRSVFFTVCLLSIVLYVFAIAFTQLSKDSPVGNMYFSNLTESIFSLLFYCCLGLHLPEIAAMVFRESWLLGLLLMGFIIIAPLTIMNMLVGVLVEVIRAVASAEQEGAVVRFVTETIRGILVRMDPNYDDHISPEDLNKLLLDEDALAAFQEVGIDILAIVKDPEIIFSGDSVITFQEFMEEVLTLRGSNTCTVKDIVQMKKQLMIDIGSLLRKRRP